MNTLIRMVTLLVLINICMYLGVNFAMPMNSTESLNSDYQFHFSGDLIQKFMTGYGNMDQLAEDTKSNYTNYGIGLNANLTTIPAQKSGSFFGGSSGIAFLDGLSIVWSFILTLFNIVLSPLTLFFNFNMPVFIGLLIGIPYFIILLFCLYALIRGVSD